MKKITPRRLLAILAISLLLSSCKKEKDDQPDDNQLPEFGTCKPVTPTGRLVFSSGLSPWSYTTSGGGHISINPEAGIIITDDARPGFTLEFWGGVMQGGVKTFSANHENLNGKHIKDRVGSTRTVIFPDGAKLTWVADGEKGALLSLSIYDGTQSYHFNGTCYTLESSVNNESVSRKLDDAEADGETCTFEIIKNTSGVYEKLQFWNIYQETTPGIKVQQRVLLGEALQSNNNVNDYYDDPRLAAT